MGDRPWMHPGWMFRYIYGDPLGECFWTMPVDNMFGGA